MDSDEEEMQRLRAYKSKQSAPIPPKPLPSTHNDSTELPEYNFTEKNISNKERLYEDLNELSEQDMLMSMGFASFGQKNESANVQEMNRKFKRVEPVVLETKMEVQSAGQSAGNKMEVEKVVQERKVVAGSNPHLSQAVSNPYLLPISHEAVMPGHRKGVGALALDPAGSRLLSGGLDYQVMMWNYGGMDANFRSFRSVEPYEGHPIEQLRYSESGDMFLCASGHACIKLYNKEGSELGEGIKGDMYILDMLRTKGHVSAINDCAWNPTNREEYITASSDGTVRIWDINNFKHHKKVIKIKPINKKCGIGSTCYSFNGKLIIAGTSEGMIKTYSDDNKYMFHKHEALAAKKNSNITSVVIASNDTSLFTRADDHSLGIWDLRKFKTPVKMFSGLPAMYSHSDLVISPDEQVILTGSCSTTEMDTPCQGQLVFIDRTNEKIIQTCNVGTAAINRVLWNKEINQIVAGSADGKIYMLYDTTLSTKGALLCVGKGAHKKNVEDFAFAQGEIYTPDSYLETEFETKGRQWRLERNKRKPEVLNHLGPNAKIDSAQYSYNSFLVDNIVKDTHGDLDPVKALHKYAEASNDPIFTRSYLKTQPKKEYDYSEYENQEPAKHSVSAVSAEDDAPVSKKFKNMKY